MKERRNLADWRPIGALLLLTASVVVSLLPEIKSTVNGGEGNVAWSIIFLLGMAVAAVYNVLQVRGPGGTAAGGPHVRSCPGVSRRLLCAWRASVAAGVVGHPRQPGAHVQAPAHDQLVVAQRIDRQAA
jgi:hypothetical protein